MEERKKILLNIIVGTIIAIIIISIINLFPLENKLNETFLAISITDPPLIPEGVEGIYLTYSNVFIHDQEKGWISLNSSGEVNLINAIDYAYVLTINKVKVKAIDIIRLIVEKAKVSYLGNNVTTEIHSNEINVKFEAISIKENEINVINIHVIPKLIPIFENEFKLIFNATSKVYPINIYEIFPGINKNDLIKMIKAKRILPIKDILVYNIINQEFKNLIKILNISLYNNKLEIFVENISNKTVIINSIILYKLTTFKIGKIQKVKINFITFLVNYKGEMFLPKSLIEIKNQIIENKGYAIKPNEIIKLSFNGEIRLLSFEKIEKLHRLMDENIIPLEKYTVIIIGSGYANDKEIVIAKG